jgi:hypothetical protein
MRTLSAILVSAAMMVPAFSHALAPRKALSTKALRADVERKIGQDNLSVRIGRAPKGSPLRPFTTNRTGGPSKILFGPRGTVNKFTGAVKFLPLNF